MGQTLLDARQISDFTSSKDTSGSDGIKKFLEDHYAKDRQFTGASQSASDTRATEGLKQPTKNIVLPAPK